MIFSPFTPIFFPSRKSDGIESRYTQIFAATDRILIQYFGDRAETMLIDAVTGDALAELVPKSYPIGDTVLQLIELKGLSDGVYRIEQNGIASSPFIVTSDSAELEDTVLIQYAMKDNRNRDDAVFMINGIRQFFDFRVPGGFKDSDVAFAVDCESYETPKGDPCTLYSLPTVQETFTMGLQEGVPASFAEMLNLALSCSYVYIDGVRYARKESSVPEISIPMEGIDSFVYKVNMQKVLYQSPAIDSQNLSAIRRASDGIRMINDLNNRIII